MLGPLTPPLEYELDIESEERKQDHEWRYHTRRQVLKWMAEYERGPIWEREFDAPGFLSVRLRKLSYYRPEAPWTSTTREQRVVGLQVVHTRLDTASVGFEQLLAFLKLVCTSNSLAYLLFAAPLPRFFFCLEPTSPMESILGGILVGDGDWLWVPSLQHFQLESPPQVNPWVLSSTHDEDEEETEYDEGYFSLIPSLSPLPLLRQQAWHHTSSPSAQARHPLIPRLFL